MKNRNAQLYTLLFLITGALALVFGELAIRFFSPTEFLYPRYEFSDKYGLIPFAGVRMVHGVPGRYTFHYSINEDRCRGDRLPEPGDRDAVVILGDSYSFGMGVDDGEYYAAVLAGQVAGEYDVINLSSPGWGLTQEIRRFHERGAQYEPSVVVLQFCGNDPEDNFIYRVTTIENDQFVFHQSDLSLNWVKKYLSKSPVQRSQLYNFFRARAARAIQLRHVRKEEARFVTGKENNTVPPQETFYVELLEHFARTLNAAGVRLVMISVDGQIDEFAHIRDNVDRLEAAGLLDYIEVRDWFEGIGEYFSLEGHWGVPAHAAIGRGLAEYIRSGSKTGNE